MKWLSLLWALCFSISIAAQPCNPTYNPSIFNANKIFTGFTPNGYKFTTPEYSGFVVPYPESRYASTIDIGNPWIASSTNGQLLIAAQGYFAATQHDFKLGPLGQDGELLTQVCDEFNRTWVVHREDIIRHHTDFLVDGEIDVPIPSIYGWPAEGNDFFVDYNGFALPAEHHGGWADFLDKNQNGKYEPNLGDLPVVYFHGDTIVPDQTMWMVFNDKGQHSKSNGRPLGVEIQFTVFGFYCQDNALLSHSLFNSYKIINQQDTQLDSVYFGFFHDYTLGCDDTDDFVGSDSIRHAEFVYNSVPIDEEQYCGYGEYPPIQSMMYLSHPMYSFINFKRFDSPQTDVEYYRYLTGRWRNGNLMYTGGNGMQQVSGSRNTRFLFHGDPRNANEWSEVSVQSPAEDRRTVSSIFLGILAAGETATVESVYAFHQDSSLQHLALFGTMYSQLDELRSISGEINQHCQSFPLCLDGDCVWPGDFNRDDVVDHRDLLHWGVMKGSTGAKRNGLISWRGHFAEDWAENIPSGLNHKHGDANGNGVVDYNDLYINVEYHGYTNPNATITDEYPEGPHITVVSEPMDAGGDIDNVIVKTNIELHNLYGIAFELEFDTFFYKSTHIIQQHYPEDTTGLHYDEPYYYDSGSGTTFKYAFVSTGEQNLTIAANTTLLRIPLGLDNKLQLPLTFLPDSVVIRIKNLVGVDKEGNDLQLGSYALTVSNALITSTTNVEQSLINVWPNPAGNQLSIACPHLDEVIVLNSLGQLSQAEKIRSGTASIDISSLPSGMYVIYFREAGIMKRFLKI